MRTLLQQDQKSEAGQDGQDQTQIIVEFRNEGKPHSLTFQQTGEETSPSQPRPWLRRHSQLSQLNQ